MSRQTPEQAPAAQPTGTVYRVALTKVNGFVVITQRRTATYRGTLDQLEDIARGVRNHNLLLGWWGFPAGLIWTPMALTRNAKAMRQLRGLAANG
jgi:8-oxo-dGTP pyrophosphatase MutT (NUDIX family)